MKCVVAGLGQFGTSVAVAFARNGVQVTAIDRDIHRVTPLADEVSLAVALDASDPAALAAQDVGDADLFVAAIGDDFESQILAVVHARELGVGKVIARATSEDHQRVLRAVGADIVLNPELESARVLVHRMLVPDIENYFELAEGFSVIEMKLPPGAVGKRLVDLDMRKKYQLNVIALREVLAEADGNGLSQHLDPVPAPERVLLEGEVLSVAGDELNLARFIADHSR